MSGRTKRWQTRKFVLQQRIREFGIPSSEPALIETQVLCEGSEVDHEVNIVSTDSTPLNVEINTSFGGRIELENDVQHPGECVSQPIGSVPNHNQSSHESECGLEHDNLEGERTNFCFELAKLSSKHHLSDRCITDVINLMRLAKSEAPTAIPKNLKQYNKQIGIHRLSAIYHWICPKCSLVTVKSAFNAPYSVICCGIPLEETCDHFILYDVKQQVVRTMTGCKYYKASNFKKTEFLNENCGFNVNGDILLTISSDGTPVFTSSRSSLWPIFGAIDNIHYSIRRQNILLLGLWISKGPKKPDFKRFLKSFIMELRNIHQETISWTDNSKQEILSRIFISCFVCDSIAKPAIQMMSQFNAEYGCGYCYHREPGHYYSHTDVVIRNHLEHENICDDLLTTRGTKFGVVFRSPIMDLAYFDIIKDFPIDVLHTVYLGVTELLTNRWLSSSSRGSPYFIDDHRRKNLDKVLLAIRPPSRVSRLPRSLSLRSSYKGHEWSMWLLYYSPIVLNGVLPEAYYDHWLNLVNGIALLNSKETDTTVDNIERGEALLNDFSEKTETLYDKQCCRFNVHLLRHLSLCVRRFGPLHKYSMMPFECYNSTLKSYITSAKGIGMQITKRFLRDLILRTSKEESTQTKSVPCQYSILERFPEFQDIVLSTCGDPTALNYFKSICCSGLYLKSVSSAKSIRRCNYFYWTVDHRVIEVFFYVTANSVDLAAGNVITVERSHVQVDHIYKILCKELMLIPISEIVAPAMRIHTDTEFFVKFVNNVEWNHE